MADPSDGSVVDELPGVQTTSPRVRRRALWGALAALAVVAGGLAVVATGDDGSPRLPIALGGTGEERTAAPAADMAMAAWVHYVAGDDLPLLGGDGPAYRLKGSVGSGDVERLARGLGLSGRPVHEDQVWRLATPDGTLEVYEGGGGLWWFSSEDLSSRDADGSVSSTGGGSSGSEGCAADATTCTSPDAPQTPPQTADAMPACTADTPPEECADSPKPDEPFVPPADLPTRAEAEAQARELFTTLGAAIDDAAVTVDGPYEAWFVMFEPRVDGLAASGLSYTASIGPKGKLLSAGGVVNRAEEVGTYPTLDTHGAIDRLNDGSGFGAPQPAQTEAEASAPADPGEETVTSTGDERVGPDGEPAATEPAIGCEAAAGDPSGKDAAEDQPAPEGEPVPLPILTPCYDEPPSEPVEIVLHRAERILTVIGANDNSSDTYLVPGYRLRGDDEALVEVASVDDDSLLPAPEPAPEPAEDPGTDTTGGSDEPATRCAPPEPGPDGAAPDICRDPNTVEPSEPSTAPPGAEGGGAAPGSGG